MKRKMSPLIYSHFCVYPSSDCMVLQATYFFVCFSETGRVRVLLFSEGLNLYDKSHPQMFYLSTHTANVGAKNVLIDIITRLSSVTQNAK